MGKLGKRASLPANLAAEIQLQAAPPKARMQARLVEPEPEPEPEQTAH